MVVAGLRLEGGDDCIAIKTFWVGSFPFWHNLRFWLQVNL